MTQRAQKTPAGRLVFLYPFKVFPQNLKCSNAAGIGCLIATAERCELYSHASLLVNHMSLSDAVAIERCDTLPLAKSRDQTLFPLLLRPRIREIFNR